MAKYVYDYNIVKSDILLGKLKGCNNCITIPNGVNIDHFKHIDKQEARCRLGLSPKLIYILFVSDPSRPEKIIL